jgi:hypothetical protein
MVVRSALKCAQSKAMPPRNARNIKSGPRASISLTTAALPLRAAR